MFGGFQNTWSAGIPQFANLSERVQQLKTGLEAGLQDSGLLGPGEAAPLEAADSVQQVALQDRDPSSAEHTADDAPSEDLGATMLLPETRKLQDLPHWQQPGGLAADNAQPRLAVSGDQDAESEVPDKEEDTAGSGWEDHEVGLDTGDGLDVSKVECVPRVLTEQHGDVLQLRAQEAAEVSALTDAQTSLGIGKAQIPQVADKAPSEPSSDNSHIIPHEEVGPNVGVLLDESPARSNHKPEDNEEMPSAASPANSLPESHPTPSHWHGDQDASSNPAENGNASRLDSEEGPASSIASATEGYLPANREKGLAAVPYAETNGSASLPLPQESAANAGQEAVEAKAGGPGAKSLAAKAVQIEALGLLEVRALAVELDATLQAREVQLERKFEEVANMQEVTHQLMQRNEELARKAAKASEEDIKTLTDEYEARLGVAERKVYALSKERDMLRRGNEKLSSLNDLIKEKDAIIAQVMEEGEQLSKKQLAQENSIKKLRAQLKDAEISRKESATDVTLERQKLDAAQAARLKAEADLASARQAHKAELEAERAHYEGLLAKSRAAQVDAESRAAASAKEGVARKLRDAELRAETLAESLDELRVGLERQRASADRREDMLKRELADMERRNQEAETRLEELTGKLPEATRPLLRQMEAMQAAAAAHAQAWQAAERTLQSRLSEAESRAASAGEKERLATDRLQAANSRMAALSAALDAVREECSEVQAKVDEHATMLRDSQQKAHRMEDQAKQAHVRAAESEQEKSELERRLTAQLEAERQNSLSALVAAENRAAALEERLRAGQLSGSSPAAAGSPPAMAGPGYKWVLAREDQEGPGSREKGAASLLNGYSAGATAPEFQRMRDSLQQKDDQLGAMQATISQLEATRDSLAEELVSLSQSVESSASLARDLERLKQEHASALARLRACTELLGEREERLLELEADIADMKALYKEQIEFVLEQLMASRSPSAAASSVGEFTPDR